MSLLTAQPFSVVNTAAGLTTTSPAYSAGDMLGSEQTVTGAAFSSGGRGVITSLMVENHSTNVTGSLDMRWFNAASTPAADNAANSWSDANARLQVVGYQIVAPVVSALNATISAGNLWFDFLTAGSANLFLNVMCLGTPAVFTGATDLQYTQSFLQWT